MKVNQPSLDDGVERLGDDQPLLGQQRFDCLDPQRRVRRRRIVAIVVSVMGVLVPVMIMTAMVVIVIVVRHVLPVFRTPRRLVSEG